MTNEELILTDGTDMPTTVTGFLESYLASFIPNAPPDDIRVRRARHAFFCGAHALVLMLIKVGHEPSAIGQLLANTMAQINQEIDKREGGGTPAPVAPLVSLQ